MSPVEVVKALVAEGVELSTDGKTIRWRDTNGWMKPDVLAILRSGKATVIDYLVNQDLNDMFEERAAILEYDAGMSRPDAEAAARVMVYGGQSSGGTP